MSEGAITIQEGKAKVEVTLADGTTRWIDAVVIMDNDGRFMGSSEYPVHTTGIAVSSGTTKLIDGSAVETGTSGNPLHIAGPVTTTGTVKLVNASAVETGTVANPLTVNSTTKLVDPSGAATGVTLRPLMAAAPSILADQYISTQLATSGGATNMNVNGASTPVLFKYTPGTGVNAPIHRIIVSVADVGTLDTDAYGNGITVTNGIKLEVWRGGVPVMSILDGITVKINPDWGRVGFDIALQAYGSGEEILSCKLDFSANAHPVLLRNAYNEELVCTIQDNLTGLTSQYTHVIGHTEF